MGYFDELQRIEKMYKNLSLNSSKDVIDILLELKKKLDIIEKKIEIIESVNTTYVNVSDNIKKVEDDCFDEKVYIPEVNIDDIKSRVHTNKTIIKEDNINSNIESLKKNIK